MKFIVTMPSNIQSIHNMTGWAEKNDRFEKYDKEEREDVVLLAFKRLGVHGVQVQEIEEIDV